MQEAGAGQVAHRPFDRVAPGEAHPHRFLAQLPSKFVDGDLDGVKGENMLEDCRLGGRILVGGSQIVVHVVHAARLVHKEALSRSPPPSVRHLTLF